MSPRTFVQRHKWWILGSALALKLLDSLPDRSLAERFGGPGLLLATLSTIVLFIGAFWLVRLTSRRYLFAVSRRLGLAFVFVGLVPLLFFAVLVFSIGALAVVNLAGREARQAVEQLSDRALEEALRARDRWATQPDRGDGQRAQWIDLRGVDGRDRHVFAWIGGAPAEPAVWRPREFFDGRTHGEPPAWLRADRFSGLVAAGDSLLVFGACSGTLSDGQRYVFAAVEPFGDRVAEFVTERTGLRTRLLPLSWVLAEPTGWSDSLDAASPGMAPASPESALTRIRLAEARRAEAPRGEPAEPDTLDINIGLNFDQGVVGHSLMMAPVMSWETGEAIASPVEGTSRLRDVPLLRLDFQAKEFLLERFLGGGAGGWMWVAIKVLAIAMFSMMVGAIAIGVRLTSSVTSAVNALHRGTGRIRDGELDHRILVKSKDQLGALATSFNDMTGSVTQLLREKHERDQLEHEMEIAASVQRTMLPERFPTLPGIEGAGWSLMAKHVGGDLYDFIPIGEDRLGVLIGDVSGKGVSSALVMSNVVSSVRSFASLPIPPGPAELLTRLNGVLFQTTVADCFVTVFYSEYNFLTGELRYCNAGHNWPLLFGASGELRETLDAGGYMLGISQQILLVEKVVHVAPGDVLLAYSDGLIDTVNALDEPFELERVKEAVRGELGRSPKQIADRLGEALHGFRGSAEEIDDVTMVIIKRVRLPGASGTESEEIVPR
jgi:sigma-B regulation protein RsbU (phosphoserine phosphatase)